MEEDCQKQSIEALEFMLKKAKEGKMHSMVIIGNFGESWFWDYSGFPDFFRFVGFLERVKHELLEINMGAPNAGPI
jgi:hypothetical protein